MWVFLWKLDYFLDDFSYDFLYNFSWAFTNVLDYIVEALDVDIFQSCLNSASSRMGVSSFSIGINQILLLWYTYIPNHAVAPVEKILRPYTF